MPNYRPAFISRPFIRLSLIAAVSACAVLGARHYTPYVGQAYAQVDAACLVGTVSQVVAGEQRQVVLQLGDHLAALLQREGATRRDMKAIMAAFASVQDPRKIEAGTVFEFIRSGGAIAAVGFTLDGQKNVKLVRHEHGFTAAIGVQNCREKVVSVSASISRSFYEDGKHLGVPQKIMTQFVSAYAQDIDFSKDIDRGDAFSLIYSVTKDQRSGKTEIGDLLYAQFSPGGKQMRYYSFTREDGRLAFYTPDGQPAGPGLLKIPVTSAKVTSGFGRRKDPFTGQTASHTGVDYSAPTGSPIIAAGGGVIKRIQTHRDYGNFIDIEHEGGFTTRYAHMNRFADGIAKGTSISRGQRIGYVGSTGRSSGPHLHFEILRNGRAIDPEKGGQIHTQPLSNSQKQAFEARRAYIDAALGRFVGLDTNVTTNRS